jgi:hypothetical protein
MRVGLAFVVVLVAVVGVQGQGGGGRAANSTPSRPANTYDPSKTQIVRGCLKPATTAGMFVVADAVEVKAGQAESPSAPKQTYAIVGVIPPSVKLKDHVNHKVELSGSIIDGGKFDVADFKMVSPKCP